MIHFRITLRAQTVSCCHASTEEHIKLFFYFHLSVSGVALITIGALQYSTYSQIGTFAGSGMSKIAIVLIAVGVTIALVSLLGHLGAFLNKSSIVASFICILIIIILLEIFTGAAFYILRSRTALLQMNSGINTQARRVVHQYSPKDRHAMNRIQEKFSCCGADSYTDWSRSVGWKNHDAVPDSCCLKKGKGCGHDKDKAHKKGCISAIKHFLLNNLVWVGSVCIALGITEVFGVLVGVCLCLDIKKKNYENIN
ncbi:CD63 antigen-like isoform X3 [Girardinichthys multiradiatus]|uniref:CD63 antigen-like isoform X3 n=1 Tax=Girardinichthys multiradiatus TaxID=208333 RepID=UPI001FAD65B6|nr:CD63 antigen-like isoform X3 [Girardinichthys multiradiatus]